MAKNTKVKALGTMAGSYGLAHTGDVVVVDSKTAAELEKAGLVKVVGDTDGDVTTPSKGSVRFADETNEAKANVQKAETETDPKNPTGAKATVKVTPAKVTTPKKGKK